MKNKEFAFLKNNALIDAVFVFADKKHVTSKKHCFAQVSFADDEIMIAKESGIRYQPVRKLHVDEIEYVKLSIQKTMHNTLLKKPEDIYLLMTVLEIVCKNQDTYCFRNGNITSYIDAYHLFERHHIPVEEVYHVIDHIRDLESFEAVTDYLRKMQDTFESIW